MTVQELIDELMEVEDKSKGVFIDNPYFDEEFFDKAYFDIDEIENFEDDVTIWVK